MTDQKTFQMAIKHLSRDKKLAKVIKHVGEFNPPKSTTSMFDVLMRIIVGQQLSGKAAQTIFDRVRALNDRKPFTPAGMAGLSDEQLQGAGISRPKIRSIRSVTDAVASGEITARKLNRMSEDEAMQVLTAVKGLGPWSVQMYLMFHAQRLDVFPPGDLGIQRAMRQIYGVETNDPLCDRITAKWRPYRTVACWYLWRSLSAGGI
jgi:3-methyladenine DNA glycosylase/8-oxoguanine DNA glycosylase